MSIIIGPFSPTASNTQFNDQLYLQSGAYIIHNPTSYQLNFKKADSNRFIVDPGTVRVVHKAGGNAGNVEWTATLVGPLAILNTPGFTIEILQQGVDDIPDEAIVSLSQIATQQPRVLTLPPATETYAFSQVNMASGAADATTIIAQTLFDVTNNTAGMYVYWVMISALNALAAAGELWVLTYDLQWAKLNNSGVPIFNSTIFETIVQGVGPIMAPIILAPAFAPTFYATGDANTEGIALISKIHISNLAAARTVNTKTSLAYDVDFTNANPPPGYGGGLQKTLGNFSNQYSGAAW